MAVLNADDGDVQFTSPDTKVSLCRGREGEGRGAGEERGMGEKGKRVGMGRGNKRGGEIRVEIGGEMGRGREWGWVGAIRGEGR